jgi:hypothetical protein
MRKAWLFIWRWIGNLLRVKALWQLLPSGVAIVLTGYLTLLAHQPVWIIVLASALAGVVAFIIARHFKLPHQLAVLPTNQTTYGSQSPISNAQRDIHQHFYAAPPIHPSAMYPQVQICKTKDSLSLCFHNFSVTADALDVRLEVVDRRTTSYILTAVPIERLPHGQSAPLELRIDKGMPGFGYPPLSKREIARLVLEPHLSTEQKFFGNLIALEEQSSGWTPAFELEMSVTYTDESARTRWKSIAAVIWSEGLLGAGCFTDVKFKGIAPIDT